MKIQGITNVANVREGGIKRYWVVDKRTSFATPSLPIWIYVKVIYLLYIYNSEMYDNDIYLLLNNMDTTFSSHKTLRIQHFLIRE